MSAIPQSARRCSNCGAQLVPPSVTEIANEAARVLSDRLTGNDHGVLKRSNHLPGLLLGMPTPIASHPIAGELSVA